MMHRVVLVGLTRAVARQATWTLLRALAAAAVAGLGWRLGADLYEVAKKRMAAAPPHDPEKPADP
jgi:hypothetical protein